MDNLDQLKQELEQARAEFADLLRITEEQTVQMEIIQNELVQLEEGRGDRVLDAIRTGDQERVAWAESQSVLGKRAQLDTVNDVLKALEPRIQKAKQWVLECKANCFQAEADILGTQANERQSKTDKLLAELKEWEGSGFVIHGKFVTSELRRQASYYNDCGERILKGQGYRYDPMGDGSPILPIPDYLGDANECQD